MSIALQSTVIISYLSLQANINGLGVVANNIQAELPNFFKTQSPK